MSEFLYPLDTTGSALSNRVRGEFQTLSPPTQSDNFHFIIPKSGPYYRDTLKIRHVSSNRLLIRGVDWEAGHYFHSASYETEGVKGGIYQSILFLDRSLSGQVELEEYFVLGGEWSLDENKILEILSNRLWDPRTITYEQVSGKPEVFPPIEHMHPAGDLTGMREQVEATYQVSAAIREQTQELPGKLETILQNYYNSRDVDDLLLGLSEQLISGIAGPEIEAMLRTVVASMIENYYTKSQVDQFISTVTNSIDAMYTNLDIDRMIAPLARKDYVDSELIKKVDVDVFESRLQSVTSGSIYRQDLDDLKVELEGIINTQGSRIDGVENTISSLADSLADYVKLNDIDRLIRESQSYSELDGQLDSLRDRLTSTETELLEEIDNINRSLTTYAKLSEVRDIVLSLLPEDTGPDLLNYSFSTISANSMVEDDIEGIFRLEYLIENIEYAGSTGNPISFYVRFLAGNRVRCLNPEGKDTVFEIPEDRLVEVNFGENGFDGSDGKYLLKFALVSSDPFVSFDLTLVESGETSDAYTGIIGVLDIKNHVIELTRTINSTGHTQQIISRLEILSTESMSGKHTVELYTDIATPSSSNLKHCKLSDSLGNTYPVHATEVIYSELEEHRVEVFCPAFDLAPMSTKKLFLDVIVEVVAR